MILKYQESWTNLVCPPSPIYRGKGGGDCRPARPGELGCFHQKAPPSVRTSWKAQVGLIAMCTPCLLNTPPLPFFCWFFFRNVMELYELRNNTYFLLVMSRNLTDYAIVPCLASWMLRNFMDCTLTLPFNSRHVAEFHGLPNDGCQVPRSGQARVASQQIDGPRTKLGYDTNLTNLKLPNY